MRMRQGKSPILYTIERKRADWTEIDAVTIHKVMNGSTPGALHRKLAASAHILRTIYHSTVKLMLGEDV